MQYLPIFTKLDNKPVLVVGGGEVALRKCRAFLKARAAVTLVAPWFCDELKEHAQHNEVTLIDAYFDESHLDGKMLVIAATDRDEVNNTVFELANARNVFVNVVDDQPKCTFIFPSIVDRNPITIAISSAGTAPVLARRLREKLETLIPQHIGPLATLVGGFRDKVKQRFKHFSDRRQFWEGVFDSSVVSKVQTGDTQGAEQQLEQMLDAKAEPEGEVYVVGAGPGDPELLTLKALQLMQQAGCSAYAGIPLTHRDHAQAIQFVTGHCKKDGQELDWQSLAKPNQTLAIYMGVIKSPHIQAELLQHGRKADTPVAVIENGTRKNQRVVTGQLGELADLIERNSIVSPALLIIGEVAALHSQLAWFGQNNQTSSYAQPLTDISN